MKFFLGSLEIDDGEGYHLIPLKAESDQRAIEESEDLLKTDDCPVSEHCYTVMPQTVLEKWHDAIERALDKDVSAHWTPEDIMDRKKCSRDEAIEFLQENRKHIQDAMVQAGWDAIDAL